MNVCVYACVSEWMYVCVSEWMYMYVCGWKCVCVGVCGCSKCVCVRVLIN